MYQTLRYRGCTITVMPWSGFYQCRIAYPDGTSALTSIRWEASYAIREAETMIDEWMAKE